MDGANGALVNKTLSEKADDLPLLPDGTRGDSSWRKAMALAELCVTDDPPPAQLTVFVDATHADPKQRRGRCRRWKPGPGSAETPSKPSSAMQSPK